MPDAPTPPRRRPYRGVAPEARDTARRERLVSAATELFATAGYASTSIDGICTAASVSKRDFYDHFANREALLIAVYDAIIHDSERELAAALAAVPAGASPATYARAGIQAFLAHMLDDPRRARINFVEVVGASHAVEAHRRGTVGRYRDQIIAVGHALMLQGAISPREPAILRVQAAVIIGALQEAVTDWLSVDAAERPSLDTVVGTLVDVVERAAV